MSKGHLLVLGSEGFIGSNAVRYFSSQGYRVTKADIHLKDAPDYFLINAELPSFNDIFTEREYDVCINATGAANVQLSFSHPDVDHTLNVSNVFHILNSIRKYNPACKFINLSSAAVYGNPTEIPIRETTPVGPLSPYGMHKLYSEQICREFHDFFGIQTVSLRIFSAYGEGLRKQLFWDLYQKIKEAKDVVELFGTGRESRDFIYIRDVVVAIGCVVQNATFDGSVINIASGVESTIEYAAHCFIKALGKDIAVRFTRNNKIGDPLNWRTDIRLLTSLGFSNRYSLAEGINNYVKWLKENG